MTHFPHRKLPNYSTLLAGRIPPDEIGFQSDRLQIWYNHTTEAWVDPLPHAHRESDECFIILRGSIVVEVEGERFLIGPRQFCCFPAGVLHQVVEVHPPAETLMLRSPSVDDKTYRPESGKSFPLLE